MIKKFAEELKREFCCKTLVQLRENGCCPNCKKIDKLVEEYTTQKHICPTCKKELNEIACKNPLIYECKYCEAFWTEEYLINSTTHKKGDDLK